MIRHTAPRTRCCRGLSTGRSRVTSWRWSSSICANARAASAKSNGCNSCMRLCGRAAAHGRDGAAAPSARADRGISSARPYAWGLSHALGGWQRIASWAKWAIAVEFGALVAIAVLALPVGETPSVYRTFGAATIRESPAGTFAVVFKPGVTESEMRRIVRSVGARVVDGPTETGAYVLAIPSGDPDRAVAVLRAEPAVTLVAALTGKQVR